MTSQTIGLILGGVIPALFFGLSGVFAKSCTNAGIGPSLYLVVVGLSVAVVGGGLYLWDGDSTISTKSGLYAVLVGFVWAIGAWLLAYTLNNFDTPISKLVPLYNMNTLVAVVLGLWMFAEWKQVGVLQLIVGAVFVIAGGVLVSKA